MADTPIRLRRPMLVRHQIGLASLSNRYVSYDNCGYVDRWPTSMIYFDGNLT